MSTQPSTPTQPEPLPMSSTQSTPTPTPTPSDESNPIREAIAGAIAEALEVPFAAVDVLPDPRIRQELSALSNWPTIPQLFAGGELIGGCDIVTEMYESGELAQALS
jgi:glutaredoxin-related protein